jgi:hypothetical protein
MVDKSLDWNLPSSVQVEGESYSSTLKMEEGGSSETLVPIYKTTQHHNP